MAKKDFKGGFDSLLQGVVQTPTPAEKVPETAGNEAPQGGHEAEHLNTATRNTTKAGSVRATFIVEADLLDKLKALAYWSRQQQKEIINNALREYLDRYEETNGPIEKL